MRVGRPFFIAAAASWTGQWGKAGRAGMMKKPRVRHEGSTFRYIIIIEGKEVLYVGEVDGRVL